MKSYLALALLLVSPVISAQQSAAVRPKITGIDHVVFYTTKPDANANFYMSKLGLASTESSEPGQTTQFLINMGAQWVGYGPAPDSASANRLDHVAFRTDHCEVLRTYLSTQKFKVPDLCSVVKGGGRSFRLKDPEGHSIEFLERPKFDRIQGATGSPISGRIIHAGFIVHDRAAEDHFYKDILGFHLYWHGGMQNDRDDWVAMQVPDGTDWVEYMLNVKPDADQRLM